MMVSHALHPAAVDPYPPPPPLARAIVHSSAGAGDPMDYTNEPFTHSPPQTVGGGGRKRKTSPAPDLLETRRLRRSHEACARCRSKKIKCDSKHPRCSACQQAGTQCHQEDRHRQTLTPRGHVEQIEAQVAVCEALLQKFIPGFSLDALYEHAQLQGVDHDTVALLPQAGVPCLSPTQQHHMIAHARPVLAPLQTTPTTLPQPPPGSHVEQAASPPFAQQSSSSAHAITLHPTLVHYSNAGPPSSLSPDSPATLRTVSSPQSVATPQSFAATPTSGFAQPWPVAAAPPRPPPIAARPGDIKGQDPKHNDLSNAKTMVESFEITIPNTWFGSSKSSSASEREESSINVSVEAMQRAPRKPELWLEVKVHHNYASPGVHALSFIYLPRDRIAVSAAVDAYFERLNLHRPVFTKREFDQKLEHLYSGTSTHDPGFICSVYLVLALGSLCELNHELFRQTHTSVLTREETRSVIDRSYRQDWPKVEELFERALAIKPDLRVTISSLQAMILLQWYLYIERHGRSLWRLVGNMVRLAIELGLHHDPYQQHETFTPEECRLRVKLWCTIMIHDRGTSILLGRPLAIAPADTTTPQPTQQGPNGERDFSDHFYYSFPIMEMQADILCSMYTPRQMQPDAKMRQAIRILQRMEQWRNDELPHEYTRYFAAPASWTEAQKREVVENVTADHGLTLLKFWIAKILLLRVLFKSRDLSFNYRSLALRDAVVTSHNIIVIHRSLVKYPDAAFFVSPMPLHISAMIIIYGVMCDCSILERQRSLDDVWLALSMLPHLRWRWERKDMQGMHPIISKIAEKVFKVNFSQIKEEYSPGALIPEIPTSEYDAAELRPQSALKGKMGRWSANSSPVPQGGAYDSQRSPVVSSSSSALMAPGLIHRPTPQLASSMQPWPEPLVGLFYPFDQENPANLQRWPNYPQGSSGHPDAPSSVPPEVSMPPGSPTFYRSMGAVGCQPAQQSFINEENDKTPPPEMNNIDGLLDMIEARGVDAVLEQNLNAGHPHFLPHPGQQHAAPHMHPQQQMHPHHHSATQHHQHPVQVYTTLPPRW